MSNADEYKTDGQESKCKCPDVDEELLLETIEAVRPSLIADGGNMEYLGVDEDGTVRVMLQGSCSGCPLSSITLSMGIERILKEHVPGVTRVEAVMEDGQPAAQDDMDAYGMWGM